MNNKLPIIISIFVLLAVIFLSFSNTGQFLGTVGDNLESYELTEVSDYDKDGVADIIECPALEALLAYDNPSEEDNSDKDSFEMPNKGVDAVGGISDQRPIISFTPKLSQTGGQQGGQGGTSGPDCKEGNGYIKAWDSNLGQVVDVADWNCNGVIVLDDNYDTIGPNYNPSERPFFACDVEFFGPKLDTDCDGVHDKSEITANPSITDPYMPTDFNDIDGDGISDSKEEDYECLDVNVKDNEDDPDNDGLTNEEEIENYSNPCIADSDGDGDLDGEEVAAKTNPTSAQSFIDSDGDDLSDKSEEQYGTDPNNPDTDGDGFDDGQEVSMMNGGRDDVDPLDVNKPGVHFDNIVCPDSTGDGPDWKNPDFHIRYSAYCYEELEGSTLIHSFPIFYRIDDPQETTFYYFNVGGDEYELQFTPISMEFGSSSLSLTDTNNDLIEAEIQIDFSEGWTERLIFSDAPSTLNQFYGPEEFPMQIQVNYAESKGMVPNDILYKGYITITVALLADSLEEAANIAEVYQCSAGIPISEPVTEEETDNTGSTGRVAGRAFADLDYLGNNNICKGSFTPDTQQTTDYNSIVLITQITDKDTNEVEDYTYSIINSPEVKLYEAYLTFDSANEDCEVFVWEDFSGKPISYAKYQPPEMSQPGSGDSNDPITPGGGSGDGYTADDLVGGSGGMLNGGQNSAI